MNTCLTCSKPCKMNVIWCRNYRILGDNYMKFRLKWFWRSIICFIKGHEDIVASFNPVSGERDLGFICARCGRPRLQNAPWLMRKPCK